jgi:hypothetical protein
MSVKHVINGVHVVPMGKANAFPVEGDDGLTLIDAGFPGNSPLAGDAERVQMGRALMIQAREKRSEIPGFRNRVATREVTVFS